VGDVVSIYNNSAAAQTITQGASVTMYLAGTATTGNRTLAQRGVCTVLCVAANTFVIAGAGLT
jgi:basic membrane lipoprotein Med (substrate-binding protein (PBP1-ABC) superfamily)